MGCLSGIHQGQRFLYKAFAGGNRASACQGLHSSCREPAPAPEHGERDLTCRTCPGSRPRPGPSIRAHAHRQRGGLGPWELPGKELGLRCLGCLVSSLCFHTPPPPLPLPGSDLHKHMFGVCESKNETRAHVGWLGSGEPCPRKFSGATGSLRPSCKGSYAARRPPVLWGGSGLVPISGAQTRLPTSVCGS